MQSIIIKVYEINKPSATGIRSLKILNRVDAHLIYLKCITLYRTDKLILL